MYGSPPNALQWEYRIATKEEETMGQLPDVMFSVRQTPWHGLGEILADYPGREEGMVLAGHNFELEECWSYTGPPIELDGDGNRVPVRGRPEVRLDQGWRSLIKRMDGDPSDGLLFHKARDSFGVIPNRVGWDLCDAIVGQGAKYETAGTLDEGASCWILAYLDEPVQITGDDSPILPFLNLAWRHDGSGALTGRSTSVRVVCRNTQSAAEAEARRNGTDYTFRHTKNAMQRVEEAKMAIKGLRLQHQEFVDMAEDLARIAVTEEQRRYFLTQFIPSPAEALISDRVMANIDEARGHVNTILEGVTVPEAHRHTAYGLWTAGVEYLDWYRRANNPETRFKRSILRAEPAKAKLHKVIRETVKA